MATINLFKANLQGKQLITEKSLTKKAVNAALRNYEATINGEFTKVIKDTDIRARNVANAAKGKFGTALDVVANCYPYQTADGVLCTKAKAADGTKVWAVKKLTAAAARGIVRDALKTFTDGVGEAIVTRVVVGEAVPEKKK